MTTPRLRWPARPRPTPRGVAGARAQVFIDPIVQRHVPLDQINACLKDHRAGRRVAVLRPKLKEPVFKTTCNHQGFEWWVVSFPQQRRLFLGPPLFFAPFFD